MRAPHLPGHPGRRTAPEARPKTAPHGVRRWGGRRRGLVSGVVVLALVVGLTAGVLAAAPLRSGVEAVGHAIDGVLPSRSARVGASAAAKNVTAGPTPPGALGTVSILHVAVPGGSASETRDVWVYRPPVPDRASLPVLYFLHGDSGSPQDVFDAGLPHIMDTLFEQGYPPFVLAAPDGSGDHHADTEWADAADGSDLVETFVTKNVIAAVEGNYRRDREHRAIAGFSMGGYGAINLGLRHPDLYGQIVTMAGYFHVDDPDHMFGGDTRLIRRNTPELEIGAAAGHRIFIVDGDQDDQRVVKGESIEFAQRLLAARVPVWFQLSPGSHSWQFVASAFPNVVLFLEGSWQSLRPPPPPLPESTRRVARVAGSWTGTHDGAIVTVRIPPPKGDAQVAALEKLRAALHQPVVDYAEVTIANPASASGDASVAGVNFVADDGLTVTADSPTSVALGWARETHDPKAEALVRTYLRNVRRAGAVEPGKTSTEVFVTSSLITSVNMVYVGDSYGEDPLSSTS